MDRHTLLIIAGPTASGKTALAKKIAGRYGGEIISADSRQVYVGMDIATGKDLGNVSGSDDLGLTVHSGLGTYRCHPVVSDGIPVWLTDLVKPDEPFSVSSWRDCAVGVIAEIWKRHRLPVVVGGTGLYLSSLLGNHETFGIPPDPQLRERVKGKTVRELQEMVRDVSPGMWETMNDSDRANPRRLVRKLEIGGAEENRCGGNGLPADTDIQLIGLRLEPNEVLYAKIDARVDKRLTMGSLSELESLLSRGYGFSLPSMSATGYREFSDPSSRKADSPEFADAVRKWKTDEHAYARRQMTWLKKMSGMRWVDVHMPGWENKIIGEIDEWYTECRSCSEK